MESENKQTQSLEALQNFINTSLETKLWQACQTNLETKILNLYRNVINNVPAYRAFLAQNNINPESIKTLQDFQSLPLLTKKNYIHKYPLPDLCRQGTLESCDFIAVSSGSTGNPTFWTRFIQDEYEITTRFEQIFCHSFNANQKRTLAVVCFTLGTWVGGIYTANCCRHRERKKVGEIGSRQIFYRRSLPQSIQPKILKSFRRQFRISDSMLNISMTKICLDSPSVMPSTRQIKSTGVSQHMGMDTSSIIPTSSPHVG